MERATGAPVLCALLDGFLSGRSRFRGSRTADEAPIRRQRPALFIKSDPQSARLAALGTDVHGLFLRAAPIALALRPSSFHVRGAVGDSAPGCRARRRGGIRLVRPARVLVLIRALAPAILLASPAESLGLHIAQANTIVQAFVKLPACLPVRQS